MAAAFHAHVATLRPWDGRSSKYKCELVNGSHRASGTRCRFGSCVRQVWSMKVETGVANVNGTALYYEVHSSRAKKPLLFLHAFANDARMWDDYLDLLKSFRLFRYDMRGFGRSELPQVDQPYLHSEDLLALLDYLQVEKVRLVAPSMGGAVALEFAADHPERVAAMCLISPSLYGHMWMTMDSIIDISDVEEAGLDALKERFLQIKLLQPTMKNDHARRALQTAMDAYSGWHFHANDPLTRKEPNTIERLSEIRAPVLVIVGEHDGRDFQLIADEIVAGAPDARKYVMEGVGHCASIENVEATKQALLDFLTQVK
ncbi:2-hydroxy-6-oxononadienedioate/2-hydroxy-6-oxononatrienedioate hydrolase [Porphyridium purpureum]|uniref:2-hydroxy-6-oxononadienedioate/2-hydroxy-6-oxononatrienedioate hydrolase n=1 Tax=Porphyridium purpureum TaxID=35688 RepID=A0A5J4YN89_PORPP|nr:2-hydroxy-6-oxononadienedioate/2-hydroxy-6-oxononatrienedioate hydrolase [Porphyridium purpureum]|eukprot:POR4719..scf295_9